MKAVLLQLLDDFLSAILFLIAYLLFGSIYLAAAVAIVTGVAQFAYRRVKGRPSDIMHWLSLGLVLVLGGATLLTEDGRFIMAKPSIIHFAIAAVMLRPGWMLRYLPPIVRDNVPEGAILAAGYAWAGLMIVLGVANLIVVATFDIATWAWFIGVVAPGAKIAAFILQYFVFRAMIRRRLMLARAGAAATGAG